MAEYYKKIVGLDYITVSYDEYKKIFRNDANEWYKHIYDRFYDRIIDNSKILKTTNLKQEDFMPLKKGLERELLSVKKYKWTPSPVSGYMDKYLQHCKI